MKRNPALPAGLMILAFITLLSPSCRKGIDFIKDPKNGQVDCKACNIKQVTVFYTTEIASYTVVYTFTYNAAGDPLTVKNTAVGTGNPNAVFKYDRHGRMVEMIRPYEGDANSYETWTKYTYNNRNQIIRDTQYVFGDYLDSVPSPNAEIYGYTVGLFKYDALERIIERTDSVFFPGLKSWANIYTFQYDANGNLIRPGAVYDSHLSILRTNKIWMFVGSDYSVNNAFQASVYNNHSLPVNFQGNYHTIFPVVSLDGAFEVEYWCN